MNCILRAAFIAAVFGNSITICNAASYVVTDLKGSGLTTPKDVNAYGQVVGSTLATERPLLWTPTTPNGTVGSTVELSSQPGAAVGINSHGQVIACSTYFDCRSQSSILAPTRLWTPETANGTSGNWVTLPSLPGDSFEYSVPRDINDLGQVVGTSRTNDSHATRHAYLWTPNTPNGTSGITTDLGDLQPNPEAVSEGWGINSSGQVSLHGNAYSLGGTAALWTPVAPNAQAGSLSSINVNVDFQTSINDAGQILGRDSNGNAFFWTPSTENGSTGSSVTIISRFLNPLPFDINSGGAIVGQIDDTSHNGIAFLWKPTSPNAATGTLIDLNSVLSPADQLLWHLQTAYALNDAGQIVGGGQFDPDGPGPEPAGNRAFLLTPVPEPPTWILGLLSVASLLGRRPR